MKDKEYIILVVDSMLDHLKEIKIQVESDKYEEANQYVDGIVNAAEDLELSLNEVFRQENLIDKDKSDSNQYKFIEQSTFDRLVKLLPKAGNYAHNQYTIPLLQTGKHIVFDKMTTVVFELGAIKTWVPKCIK